MCGWQGPEAGKMVVLKFLREKCRDALGQLRFFILAKMMCFRKADH